MESVEALARLDEQALEEERERALGDLLAHSHHGTLPLREAFLQMRGSPPQPGPFSELIRGRHRHALDTYLLVVAATAAPPHELHVNPDYWSLLLRRPDQSLRNSRQAVYRSFGILQDLALLSSETHLGALRYRLLDEGGRGDRYVHPAKAGDRYFTLPHAYWGLGLDRKLDLPGKAVLLLARSLRRYFTLPLANASSWYGISSDTLRRGMDELVRARVVRYQRANVPTPKAPRGTTVRRTYTLVGPMALEKREKHEAPT